ncbi:MAG TPA: SulP family inorganic anion transporter [Pyrinomonadaceae bacterium]|nr:SulP family inorganic anion transporter [Pyrinomonadaceae bacterium]
MSLFSNAGGDLAAGLVVFFVALPLCLGIALASGAPLFSGLIAGMVGGIVVGLLSKSHLSVSGPAAGLTAIVLAAVTELKAFDIFLCAVLIAGVVQLALGLLKAGTIANYLPSNVIEGMLAGIGLIIILKQLPHAVGFDRDAAGNFSFLDTSGAGTFAALAEALDFFTPGAVVIALFSILIMKLWEKVPALKRLKVLPGPLVAVVCGVLLNEAFTAAGSSLAVGREHLVNLPASDGLGGFFAQFTLPDLAGFSNQKVWTYGLTIAVVASIETLLCIEAVDTLDPHKRYTPPNHELKAQGVGNILNGLVGGLPLTSVIVRSSANVNAGAYTKLSCVAHGVLLLVCAAAVPFLLNKIPLAVLAAILILTGYKLANPALLRRWWSHGRQQFAPFVVTVVGVVLTDLLVGVAMGLAVSVAFILRENQKSAYFFRREKYQEGDIIHIHLAQEVTFLNKAAIKLTLEHLPPGAYVIIDASETVYIDHDVMELVREFSSVKAPERNIRLELVGFRERYNVGNTLDGAHIEIEHTETPDGPPPRRGARLRHERLIQDLTRERLGQEGA